MREGLGDWEIFRKLTWQDVLLVVAVLLLAHVLVVLMRKWLTSLAERVPPRRRLAVLRLTPILRLAVRIGAALVIVPMLVEPTFRNVMALVASVGLALAFAFKDYGTSLVAGLVTVLENTYQPGDWIEVDGAYGEVRSINARAVHLVTPDDTEVIVPHSRLWSRSVFNATSGNRSLLCVANFYLHPDHDAAVIRRRLAEVANSSSYRKPETPVAVIALEKPWGTHYRVKAYVRESREQFLFITDLTVRGKGELRTMEVRFAQAPYAETESSLA